jgi:tetratricopeptide (TPR) repeat protein
MIAARERPDDPEARAAAGQAWLELGKPKVARIWLLDAVHMAPKEERYKRMLLQIEEALLTTDEVWGPEKGTAVVVHEPAPWELASTSTVAPPSKPSLESQMNALLGGDLFRERTQMIPRVVVTSLTAPAKKGRVLAYAVAAGVLGSVFAGAAVLSDLERTRERELVAKDLAVYLATGSLDQAAEALDHLRSLGELDPVLEARAEATLYRYGDHSDVRRARAAASLRGAKETDDALVARALIASDSELRMMQDDLRAVWKRSGDGEAAFLLAVIVGQQRAYEAAIDLEPSHIPHLAHYAMFLGNTDAARDVLDQIRDVDPESPWVEKLEKELER